MQKQNDIIKEGSIWLGFMIEKNHQMTTQKLDKNYPIDPYYQQSGLRGKPMGQI